MEFRKMVMIILYARQQKRHRCIEQSFGVCGRGRGRGWDDLGGCNGNMYNRLQFHHLIRTDSNVFFLMAE